MPEFKDLKEMIIQGLKVFLVGFIYFLPVIIISAIAVADGMAISTSIISLNLLLTLILA